MSEGSQMSPGAASPRAPGVTTGKHSAVRGFLPIFSILSLLVTPAAMILAVILGSGAQPSYGAAMSLFPYSALGVLATQAQSRGLWIAIAVAQFPIYGILLDIFLWKRKFTRAILILAAIHIAVAILCLSGIMPIPVVN